VIEEEIADSEGSVDCEIVELYLNASGTRLMC